MKKYIQFLFLILCLQSFSQNINFDTFIEYKGLNNGIVHYFFFDSASSSYHFSGYNNDNDKILGSLIDNKLYKNHLYYLKNSGKSIVFEYYYSREFNPNKKYQFSNYYYEQKEEVIDSVTTKLTFFGYKNKKKKKLLRIVEVITIKSKLEFKFDFLNIVTHGLFLNSNIEILNDLPISVKIFDRNNILKEEYKLITNKDVKAQITLPKTEIH